MSDYCSVNLPLVLCNMKRQLKGHKTVLNQSKSNEFVFYLSSTFLLSVRLTYYTISQLA